MSLTPTCLHLCSAQVQPTHVFIFQHGADASQDTEYQHFVDCAAPLSAISCSFLARLSGYRIDKLPKAVMIFAPDCSTTPLVHDVTTRFLFAFGCLPLVVRLASEELVSSASLASVYALYRAPPLTTSSYPRSTLLSNRFDYLVLGCGDSSPLIQWILQRQHSENAECLRRLERTKSSVLLVSAAEAPTVLHWLQLTTSHQNSARVLSSPESLRDLLSPTSTTSTSTRSTTNPNTTGGTSTGTSGVEGAPWRVVKGSSSSALREYLSPVQDYRLDLEDVPAVVAFCGYMQRVGHEEEAAQYLQDLRSRGVALPPLVDKMQGLYLFRHGDREAASPLLRRYVAALVAQDQQQDQQQPPLDSSQLHDVASVSLLFADYEQSVRYAMRALRERTYRDAYKTLCVLQKLGFPMPPEAEEAIFTYFTQLSSNVAEAIAFYREAIKFGSPLTYFYFAMVLLELDDKQKARKLLEASMQAWARRGRAHAPTYTAYASLLQICYPEGLRDDAIHRCYQKSLEADPSDIYTLVHYGAFAQDTGMLRRALALEPRDWLRFEAQFFLVCLGDSSVGLESLYTSWRESLFAGSGSAALDYLLQYAVRHQPGGTMVSLIEALARKDYQGASELLRG